ncbi:MAG: tetratricopeptide repeat protein [Aggregatilineaceae bacterium]
MGISSDLLNAPKEFLRLFKEGKEAAKRGDRAKAHELFRQAIEIDPYHEQVWLWLASVVDTDEDRQVCFENVLELNPSHPTARQQLQRLEQRRLQEVMTASAQRHRGLSRRRKLFRLVLIVLIVAGIAVALIAWGAV